MAVSLALALIGCGGDDEEPAPTTETQTGATETTETSEGEATEAETEDVPSPTAEEPTETEPSTSPEDEPGGAGDEEPARSLALFTADNGRIRPRVVRVPPFISIRVELRSRDGNSYGLTFAGRTIEVSDGLGSVSTTLDGLRPGRALVGVPMGATGRVRIEATGEPGP